MANPLSTDSQSVLTIERLMAIQEWMNKLDDFVKNVYMVDVAAIGAFYPEWTQVGRGVVNYLAAPDIPLDSAGTKFAIPGGYIPNGDLTQFKPITAFGDKYFEDGVSEAIKHSWYEYGGGDSTSLHPYKGETKPHYTDFQDEGKYSWLKSPTFLGKPAQVGPLARVLCGLAAKHDGITKYATGMLDTVSSLAKTKVGLDAMHSTIGRHASRAIMCGVELDTLKGQWQMLVDNMAKGDLDTFNAPVFPKGEIQGVGFHEAPRGILSHWVVIENQKIKNYQCVVPSTWNAAPKNEKGEMAPYEACLIGNPVIDAEKPLEVLRTIHSFDPCLACAVHILDTENAEVVRVKAS